MLFITVTCDGAVRSSAALCFKFYWIPECQREPGDVQLSKQLFSMLRDAGGLNS